MAKGGLRGIGLYQTLYLEWRCCADETMIFDHIDLRIRDSRQAEYMIDGESLFRTCNAPPYQVERRGAAKFLVPVRLSNWVELKYRYASKSHAVLARIQN